MESTQTWSGRWGFCYRVRSRTPEQVKWVRDNLDGYLNFYSVSGDGRVTNWTLVKNCLWHSDQLTIRFARQLTNLAEAELGRWVFVSS